MKSDAIILAGGLGTRLRGVVADLPKPMAPVHERPFLDYILENIDLAFIDRFIFSIGYLGEKIQQYYGNSYKGKEVVYCVENEPLGTGGGIKKAMQMAKSERVLIFNGDTFFDVDMNSFNASHRAHLCELSVALKTVSSPDRYGTVELENGRISKFKEKQSGLEEGMINGGVYCINRNLLDQFPAEEKFSFETEILEKKVNEWKMCGFISEGLFIDIGIPEDYAKADEIFS